MRLPPSPGVPPAIRICRCRLDGDDDISIGDAFESLAAPEVARSARLIHRRDAERYIRGRGFLRRTLGRHLGLAASQVDVRPHADGKLFVPGAPFDFNLTHSADWAVLAVSLSGPVGIDLELRAGPLRDWENLLDTGHLCFVRRELDVLAGLSGAQQIARFLSFWTAKEARMKLLGHGMKMDPRTIRLRLSGGEPVGYCGDAREVALHRIETAIPGAICHLACFSGHPGLTVG